MARHEGLSSIQKDKDLGEVVGRVTQGISLG